MPRCRKCGEPNESGDIYCWRCGARLPPELRLDGVEALLGDFRFQSLWALRLFAYVLDLIFVGILSFLLSVFAFVPLMLGSLFGDNWSWQGIWAVPLFLGLAQVVYSVVLELLYGATFGKQILGLVVLSKNGGRPGFFGVVVRNLSKAHWVLLLLDFMVGVFPSKIPRDKYLDKVSGTYISYSGRGVQIPFLARPRVMRSDSREIIPSETVSDFDPFSIVNFGVFFVVSATILVNSPETVGAILSWLISLSEGSFVLPPDVVFVSGYWFFVAMGVWSIASGVLRYYLWVIPLKSVQEVFNGLFSLVWAGFIRFYLMGVFNLTFFAASVVVFFVAQIIFALYYSRFSD